MCVCLFYSFFIWLSSLFCESRFSNVCAATFLSVLLLLLLLPPLTPLPPLFFFFSVDSLLICFITVIILAVVGFYF